MAIDEISALFADYGIMCSPTPRAVNTKTGITRYDAFEHDQPYCYIFQDDLKMTVFLIATNELFGPFCDDYRHKIEKYVLKCPVFCTVCSDQVCPVGYIRIPNSHTNTKNTWTGYVLIKSREDVNYYCWSCWDFQNKRSRLKTIKCFV